MAEENKSEVASDAKETKAELSPEMEVLTKKFEKLIS